MKITDVNEQFFKLFQGFAVKKHNSEISVIARYYKLSSGDYVEEFKNQQYPCIVIQDYQPTIRENWYIDQQKYLGYTDTENMVAELVRYPIWMDFRYDVSVVTKSYIELKELKEQFFQKFVSKTHFLFNEFEVEGDKGGDVVPYSINATDVPRTDGCFEVNYEFTLNAWAEVSEVELKPIIIGIDINVNSGV